MFSQLAKQSVRFWSADMLLALAQMLHAPTELGHNLVPRGCIPFGQHQGCKTSGIKQGRLLSAQARKSFPNFFCFGDFQ